MEAAALGQAQEELSLLERETVLPTHETDYLEGEPGAETVVSQ